MRELKNKFTDNTLFLGTPFSNQLTSPSEGSMAPLSWPWLSLYTEFNPYYKWVFPRAPAFDFAEFLS